ncbi:hypothetical protein B0H10DRAFT_2337684 [Mycena sp. CBHHK59/15]|nr:hypothetical protein B0H10DRAFT_2337684 [Mycena sp. CBHHK59/15]
MPSQATTAMTAIWTYHILSGGYWLQDAAWVHAGNDVHRILRDTPIIQRHLGWAPPPVWTAGLIQAVAQKKQQKERALTSEETLIVGAANPALIQLNPSTAWTKGVNVTAQSGDCCQIDSWAIFRINDVSLPISQTEDILTWSRCDASGVTRQMQERKESDTLIHFIIHKDDDRFMINTHGFHNAGLLRKYLLTKPRPLFLDRRKRHDDHSENLAVAQKQKHAATQEKAVGPEHPLLVPRTVVVLLRNGWGLKNVHVSHLNSGLHLTV